MLRSMDDASLVVRHAGLVIDLIGGVTVTIAASRPGAIVDMVTL